MILTLRTIHHQVELTTTVVSSSTSKDSDNNNTSTVAKNTRQQTQVIVSPLSNLDTTDDDDIDFDTPSSISYKRKEIPTKNSNRKKIVKTSINTTTISLNVTVNPDTNNDDENNVQQLKEPSNIWQYAIRNDSKSATCLLCDRGNTGPLPRQMLQDEHYDDIRFEKANTFCFDSESFRCLAARKCGVTFDQFQNKKCIKS
jgi:hypothetical protein